MIIILVPNNKELFIISVESFDISHLAHFLQMSFYGLPII